MRFCIESHFVKQIKLVFQKSVRTIRIFHGKNVKLNITMTILLNLSIQLISLFCFSSTISRKSTQIMCKNYKRFYLFSNKYPCILDCSSTDYDSVNKRNFHLRCAEKKLLKLFLWFYSITFCCDLCVYMLQVILYKRSLKTLYCIFHIAQDIYHIIQCVL